MRNARPYYNERLYEYGNGFHFFDFYDKKRGRRRRVDFAAYGFFRQTFRAPQLCTPPPRLDHRN